MGWRLVSGYHFGVSGAAPYDTQLTDFPPLEQVLLAVEAASPPSPSTGPSSAILCPA